MRDGRAVRPSGWRRLRRLWIYLALLPALLSLPGPGPEPAIAKVEPGAVVTIAVPLGAATIDRSVGYAIAPAPGVRVMGGLRGILDWSEGETPVLPVTLSISRDEPAGIQPAAEVVLVWTGGREDTVQLRVNVERRYRLKATITAESGTITPGGSTLLHYQITNRGNSADTVQLQIDADPSWRISGANREVVVPRGEAIEGEIRVTAAPEARIGETRVIELAFAGRGEVQRSSASLYVAREPGLLPGFTHLPGTIFLGVVDPGSAELGAGNVGVAVNASGEVAPQTHVSFSYGHHPEGGGNLGLRSHLAGERLHLGIHRPDWSASLGQVYGRPGDLVGTHMGGNGVDLRLTGERLVGELFLARPHSFTGAEGGLLAHAKGGLNTRAGTFLLTLSDLATPSDALFRGQHTQSLGMRYEIKDVGIHSLAAEAGMVRFSDSEGTEVTGPAAFAEYSMRGTRASLAARARWAPPTLPGSGAPGNEAFLGGSAALVGSLNADAWLFRYSIPTVGGGPRTPTAEGAAFGLRYSRDGGMLALRANYQHSDGATWGLGGSGEEYSGVGQRTVAANVSVPLGPLALDGTAEFGKMETNGTTSPVQNHRGILSWSSLTSRGWIGANYSSGAFGPPMLRADLGGSVKLSSVELEVGGGAPIDGSRFRKEMSLWNSLAVNLSRKFALVIGTEYQPWNLFGSAWRTAVGVRTRLSLPIPVPQVPLVEGIVFEDLNWNRRYDSGEPGLPDIFLRLGPLQATTDMRGRFTFLEEAGRGHTLNVDPTSLRMGMMIPPDVRIRSTGRVEIPVIRTTSLQIHIALRQGRREGAGAGSANVSSTTDMPAANAVASLVDAQGRRHDVAADGRGIARMDDLPPGQYTLTVHSVPGLDRPITPRETQFLLGPGESRSVAVVIPYTPREIRFAQNFALRQVSREVPVATRSGGARAQSAVPSGEQVPAAEGAGRARVAPGARQARASLPTPLQEATRVYQVLSRQAARASGVRGERQISLRQFEREYVPRYPSRDYAARVRAYLLALLQRVDA